MQRNGVACTCCMPTPALPSHSPRDMLPLSPPVLLGILALPRVFSLLGVGTGTVWLVFMALLTYFSMTMLTGATIRTGIMNYRQAGSRVQGAGLLGATTEL